MQLVKNRAPQYPGRVTLTPVSGNTYDLARADQPTQGGTAINAQLLNGLAGFSNMETTFNADGSITQTDATTGATLTTVFNSDGTITETLAQGGDSISKTTTFNSDGSIEEEVTTS